MFRSFHRCISVSRSLSRIGERIDNTDKFYKDADRMVRAAKLEPGVKDIPRTRVPLVATKSFEERTGERERLSRREWLTPINIGLPLPEFDAQTMQERRKQLEANKKNPELERLSRTRKLQMPLKEAEADWLREGGIEHVYRIASHYGVYRDLFREPHFFMPTVPLHICYPAESDAKSDYPVFWGNFLTPSGAKRAPSVRILHDDSRNAGKAESLWTLLLTSPDEHLQNNGEYVHWLVANIPTSDLSKGETICEYVQPLAYRGAGHFRYVFVLFKQHAAGRPDEPVRVDLAASRAAHRDAKRQLQARHFSTYEFYRANQQQLTPCGLSFFQSEHDDSVRQALHTQFDMREPHFSFDWPAQKHQAQKEYPENEPFDDYLDAYRDKKDIQEEVLKARLAFAHPFNGYAPRPKFPLLDLERDRKKSEIATWQHDKLKKQILRRGVWKQLDPPTD